MFVKTTREGRVNLNEVVQLRKISGGTLAELHNGRSVEIPYSLDHLERASCSVIAAQPGFELLTVWFDEKQNRIIVDRTPIIGWRIEPHGAEPFTVELSEVEEGYIKYPDGQVLSLGVETFKDEATWLARMETEYRKASMKEAAHV